MATRTRIEPIDREFELALRDELDPAQRSRQFAAFAAEEIDKAAEENRKVLGRTPGRRVFVDGREGAPLDSVSAGGVISAKFELFDQMLEWIGEQLVKASPVLTGRFSKSHVLLADGVEIDTANPPADASEFIFLNTQPYARKIERGQSSLAPDGVYEAVAAMASRRFGNIGRIGFSYRSPLMGYVAGGANREERARLRHQPARRSAMAMERTTRVPAIIVRTFG
ncbi:hypothetical protein [Aureimonas mangrovi]|uniref:hypothetical protein n=1 Tax=Aureimonas mangrovi TaxID=2758041 RepID=UPI00163D6095|nr:hypothetical protein [Aureimonas mangrovi]